MRKRAGERLFDAIGQLPDEMILEAEKDGMHQQIGEQESKTERDVPVIQKSERQEIEKQKTKVHKIKIQKRKKTAGGYLKYLPVAACLFIVFGSAYYILDNYIGTGKSAGFADGAMESVAEAGGAADMELEDSDEDVAKDKELDGYEAKGKEEGNDENSSSNYDLSDSGSADQKITDSQPDGGDGLQENGGSTWDALPVRYDGYEGPVFPLTATGDTQKLKTKRSLKGVVTQEAAEKVYQPLLHITDTYEIKNTSHNDKTLQLVYPFAATLNLAYEPDGGILQVQGPDGKLQTDITYNLGDSVRAYRSRSSSQSDDMNSAKPSVLEDYERLTEDATEYQEHALEKEADWNREVSVYTFSQFQMNSGSRQSVAGITVNGPDADVLTFGFDYASPKEDGRTTYCFFVPEEEQKIMLIVTGEQEGEPEYGFYSNLDCEEQIDGISCEMSVQKMSYANALRLCSGEAAKQMQLDYEQGVKGELPEYMDADAAFSALTVISDEDGFYDALTVRYRSTELKEIFGQIFGETRIIYAMATVTIPAKESLRVTARTWKRQNSGHYTLMDSRQENETEKKDGHVFQYDFLSSRRSRLNMKKTNFHLVLPKGWQAGANDMNLEKKKALVWKAVLYEDSYSLTVTEGKKQ